MSKEDEKDGKKKIKIRPVEYSLICDHASVTVDGKLNLNGIFDRIVVKEFPATHAQMFVLSKLILPKGDHKISFTLQQEDKILAKSQIEKNVEQPITQHTHLWTVKGLTVENEEPLEMQIMIGGQQVFVRKIPVVKAEAKK